MKKIIVSSLSKDPSAFMERRSFLSSIRHTSFPNLFSFRFNPTIVSKKNCENLVGAIEIPVGVAGPLSVHNLNLPSQLYIPLATTEGALIASVNRGMKLVEKNNGVKAIVKNAGISRTPVFECTDGNTAFAFQMWLKQHVSQIKNQAEKTSNHLSLISMNTWIIGRHVYVRFLAQTDQAMGMNIITIALQHVLETVIFPTWKEKVHCVSISSNMCTDKKSNILNTMLGRGYWAQAECLVSITSLRAILHVSPKALLKVHIQKNLVGSALAGSHSQNAQVANIVSALFLATGQDPAHIIEASHAYTTIESHKTGLYTAVTIPNINLGTIGGGTTLPAFEEARKLITNNLTPTQLAGIIASTALCGELSLLAALAQGTLAKAHKKLGRITY